MDKDNFYKFLRRAAVFGNALYILWILYNAVDEGFKSIRTLQAAVLSGLILLLLLNIIIISSKSASLPTGKAGGSGEKKP
jgi:hypothetical protein